MTNNTETLESILVWATAEMPSDRRLLLIQRAAAAALAQQPAPVAPATAAEAALVEPMTAAAVPHCHPAAADAVLAALVTLEEATRDPEASIAAASLLARRAISDAALPIPSAETMAVCHFSLSFWLQDALKASQKRDPLDAVRDAELLLGALRLRLDAAMQEGGAR